MIPYFPFAIITKSFKVIDMADMISMAIMLHVGSILLILLLLALLLWHFSKEMEFKEFSIKYEQLSLYYRATLGSLFFTGLVDRFNQSISVDSGS